MPLPAAVPMSDKIVPSSPDVSGLADATVTFKLVGNPTVETLPKASCALITGCVPKGEPTRDIPPGSVVKVKRLAALGPTTMFPEVQFVNPVAVKLSVIVSATL